MVYRNCILGLLASFISVKALGCGSSELNLFISKAQEVAAQSQALGRKLLACPNEALEASYWLNYSTAPTKAHIAQVADYPRLAIVPGEKGKSDKEVQRAIQDALQGKVKALQSALEEGDPRFKQSPIANLTLARILVLQGNIVESKRYYESYFRLVASDDAAEIEYLYLQIKSGDLVAAQREFNMVRTEGRTPRFKESVERGKAFLAAQSQANSPSFGPNRQPLFSTTLVALSEPNVVQRGALRVAHHGPIGLAWEHHLVRLQTFDESTTNLDILSIDSSWQLAPKLAIGGEIGSLTQAYRGVMGRVFARLNVSEQLEFSGELERKPLFLEHTLTKDDMDLFQMGISFSANWKKNTNLTSSYGKDDNKSIYSNHRAQLALNFGKTSDTSVDVVPFVSYSDRAKPSPYYDSYAKEYHIGTAVEWTKSISEDFGISTLGTYTLKQRKPFGATTMLQASQLDGELKITRDLNRDWQFKGSANYSIGESEIPTQKTEQAFAFLLSLIMMK